MMGMFVVEFQQKSPFTGKMYTPCGSGNTWPIHLQSLSAAKKRVRRGVKPPAGTERVMIYRANSLLDNYEGNFVCEMPLNLVGSEYMLRQ